MRLVDIELIVEMVKGEHEKVQNRFNEANVFKEPNDVALWGAVLQEVGAFIGLMINAPTVDAVPVIRCKDCKRWATDDGMFKDIDERQWHHCPHIGIDTEEYFFCSEAERKEHETN